MKEYVIPLLLSMITTLLNYIFISAISAKTQGQIIQDFKQVLDYIINDVKKGQGNLNEQIVRNKNDIIAEIKEAIDQIKESK